MKERILVTGATGFIGRALVKELVNKGFEVFTLYKSDQFEKRIEGVNMIGPIDLTSERSVEEIVNIKPEIIVNLASRTPVRFSYSDPWDYFSTNVRIAINVANATIKANSHLIHASTAEVYPYTDRIYFWKENELLYPTSPYAISKQASEAMIYNAFLKVRYAYHKNIVILRPTNTFGRILFDLPEEAKGYFIEKVIYAYLKDEKKLELDGHPLSSRQWMFYKDHVNAYLFMIDKLLQGGFPNPISAYNVAPQDIASCNDIVTYLIEQKGWKVTVEWMKNPRPIEPNYLLISTDMIRVLGWRESYNWLSGLEAILKGLEKILG